MALVWKSSSTSTQAIRSSLLSHNSHRFRSPQSERTGLAQLANPQLGARSSGIVGMGTRNCRSELSGRERSPMRIRDMEAPAVGSIRGFSR